MIRLASPAPDRPERTTKSDRLEAEVFNTCKEWAVWHRQRGFYGAPAPVHSILGQLVRIPGNEPPNARIDPALAAFHLAVVQTAPREDVARRCFEAHFLSDKRHIKRAAADFGISRASWYRYVNDFARTAYRHHLHLRAELSQIPETT